MAKYWTSPVPQFDDFGDIISDIVIDGKSALGPWGLFTPASYANPLCARWPNKFGTGIAQKYQKQKDGKWLKIEG
jgi:hypothetical protein